MPCGFLDLREEEELSWTVCVSYSRAVQKATYSIKDTIALALNSTTISDNVIIFFFQCYYLADNFQIQISKRIPSIFYNALFSR